MKLTPSQKALLKRERNKDGDREFVITTTTAEDRVAKALQDKGLGTFQDNGWQYSWRKRDGYTNTFWINTEALRKVIVK